MGVLVVPHLFLVYSDRLFTMEPASVKPQADRFRNALAKRAIIAQTPRRIVYHPNVPNAGEGNNYLLA
jgi:hypothetical protein